jgi:hypothetical protein
MNNYENRMEQSDRAAAALVTPRSGYEFDDPDGSIRRGVAVRSDHPCVAKNRGAFMLATGGCHPHPSVRPSVPVERDEPARAVSNREDTSIGSE